MIPSSISNLKNSHFKVHKRQRQVVLQSAGLGLTSLFLRCSSPGTQDTQIHPDSKSSIYYWAHLLSMQEQEKGKELCWYRNHTIMLHDHACISCLPKVRDFLGVLQKQGIKEQGWHFTNTRWWSLHLFSLGESRLILSVGKWGKGKRQRNHFGVHRVSKTLHL